MSEIEMNVRSMLTGELLRMVRENADEYTMEALQIALDELKQRNISPETLKPMDELQSEDSNRNPTDTESTGEQTQIHLLLREELQYEESYGALLEFVDSMSIRCGEYEGASLVVKKMDRDNFILYSESALNDARVITSCTAMTKQGLISLMEEIARANGLQLEEPYEE